MGDDLILVSVSSERYLVTVTLFPRIFTPELLLNKLYLTKAPLFFQHLSYASGDLMVDASFMQTLWTMTPVMSGCELAEGRPFYKTQLLFKGLFTFDKYDFSSRFSLRRVRAKTLPWSHGRVFGDSRSRPRGRPAQVTNILTYYCCHLK